MSNTIETPTPELNKALAAAQGEMPAIPFDATNPFLKNRYASLGSVISTSRPILAKHGLAIEQKPYSKEGRIGVKTVMRHVSGECSESELDMPLFDEKGTSAVQKAGSIITYLRRYAWSAVCGLYADEDTDGTGGGSQTHTPPVSSPPKPKPASPPPQAAKTPPVASQTPPTAKRTPAGEKEHIARLETWLEQCKTSLLKKLEPVIQAANDYAVGARLVMPNEILEEVTLAKLFPSVKWDLSVDENKLLVKKDFDALTTAVQSWMDGDALPDEDQIPGAEVLHPDPDPAATAMMAAKQPLKAMMVDRVDLGDGQHVPLDVHVPRDEHLDPNSPDAAWRTFPMPWGKQAGVKLAELEKSYLFGLWANYTVETEYKGKAKKPESIAKDTLFREHLNSAGAYYEFTKKD